MRWETCLPDPLDVRGTPKEFDAFLRPPLRMLQLLLGIGGTLALGCYGEWWAMPLPLAASFVLYEWFFWSRADKPIRLRATGDRIVLDDPFVQKHRTVSLDSVRSATLLHRAHPRPGHQEIVVLLSSEGGPELGLQFVVPEGTYEPVPGDVDIDLCNAVLGSISGLIRAVCPREKLMRQPLTELQLLHWLRDTLPAECWARSGARFWTGKAPDLDLFGYHAGSADGWVELDGDQVAWPGKTGRCEGLPPTRSSRVAVLFRMDGEDHSETPEALPLWHQPVGPRTVVIPAPLLDPALTVGEATDQDCHVHAPEGAVLLWHLWRHLPPEQWPAAWHDALRQARPHVARWPEGLPEPAPAAAL